MNRMRFLIVEDDENKRGQLNQFLATSWPEADIVTTISLQSGLKAATSQSFTFILLDMTLPNYDVGPDEEGGTIHQLGGKEFLRRMKRASLATPTVVVTQFETFGRGRERVDLDSLRSELNSEYSSFCVGTVYYNNAIDSWKHELAALIRLAHPELE